MYKFISECFLPIDQTPVVLTTSNEGWNNLATDFVKGLTNELNNDMIKVFLNVLDKHRQIISESRRFNIRKKFRFGRRYLVSIKFPSELCQEIFLFYLNKEEEAHITV